MPNARRFNLLYIPSLHPIQEYDDCLTWKCLDIKFFSTGYLRKSGIVGDMQRINVPLRNISMKGCSGGLYPTDNPGTPIARKNADFTGGKTAYNIWKFTPQFLSNFDVVIACHFPHNIVINWEILQKQKKVCIIKTFGMQPPEWENIYGELRKRGVLIIRNSPAEEHHVYGYCGHDAIIRGSCTMGQYHTWKGIHKKCVTFTSNFNEDDPQSIRRRKQYEQIRKLVEFPMELYGAANQTLEYSNGFASYKDKIYMLKRYYVNLVTGTPNSNNTFSAVEAFCVGQPSVVFNRKMWGCNSSELDDLMDDGVDVLFGKTPEDCADKINFLMRSPKTRNMLSKNVKKKANKIWSRRVISRQWKAFFEGIGFNIK